MTFSDLGAIGEFVGSLAVLLTLIYLARQIRQNGESAKLNGAQAILRAINVLVQAAASSPDQTKVLVLGQTNISDLNDSERAQMLTWLHAWRRALEQGHIYHEKGLLDDEVLTGHLEHLRASAGSDAMQYYWPERPRLPREDIAAMTKPVGSTTRKPQANFATCCCGGFACETAGRNRRY